MHTFGTNWTYNGQHYDIAQLDRARLLLDAMVAKNNTVLDLWNELKIFELELQKHNQLDLFKNEVNRMIRGNNPKRDGVMRYIHHIYNATCEVHQNNDGDEVDIMFRYLGNEERMEKCALSLAWIGNPTGFKQINILGYSQVLPTGYTLRSTPSVQVTDVRSTLLAIFNSSKKWQGVFNQYREIEINFMLICKTCYKAVQEKDTNINALFPREVWYKIFDYFMNDAFKGKDILHTAYQEWRTIQINRNKAKKAFKQTSVLTPINYECFNKITPEYIATIANVSKQGANNACKDYWLNYFKTGAKILISTFVWTALPFACFKALSRTTSLGVAAKLEWTVFPFLFGPMLIAGTYITLEPIKNSYFKKPKLKLDIEPLSCAYTLLNMATTFLSALILERLGYSHLMPNACINFAKPAIIKCLLAPVYGRVAIFTNFNPFIRYWETKEEEYLKRTYHNDFSYGVLPTYALNIRRLFIYCAQEYAVKTFNAIAL